MKLRTQKRIKILIPHYVTGKLLGRVFTMMKAICCYEVFAGLGTGRKSVIKQTIHGK